MNLAKRLGKLNVRKYSFVLRVNNWNSLPEWVVSAKSINEFKDKLEKFWAHKRFISRQSHACAECSVSVQTFSEEREQQA